jgi:hypothetical protein
VAELAAGRQHGAQRAEPMNQPKMSSVECSFKSLTAPHFGELLQSQNSLTFKLLKTGK